MRLAIIADTHMPKGKRELPERCVEELGRADLIVHLGDFSAASVLEWLEGIGPPVVGIHGNVDDAEIRRRLPGERELELEGVRLGLVHDSGPRRGRLARLRERFPDADTVMFAHSHLPLHERDGCFQIFNPGSPTERRRAPTRTMGLGEIEDGQLNLELVELV
ncbi:MAG TPA: metallophosphoesterase family protein [Solirubrobacterales bacterium]|nr:metallophosphoesterase family protein [Solirubrobacterales bacterium]